MKPEHASDGLKLRSCLENDAQDVRDLLAELTESKDDLLETDIEFYSVDMLNGAWKAAETLSNTFTEAYSRTSHETAYRSVFFAWQVGQYISRCHINADIGGYFLELGLCNNARAKMIDDVQDYLANNRAVDQLIGEYAPQLDKSGKYRHVAEACAGMMFMLIDRHIDAYYGDPLAETE